MADLIKHVSREFDFFYSDEMETEFLGDNEKGPERDSMCEILGNKIIGDMLTNDKFAEIVRVHSQRMGLERKAILWAHGSTNGRSWRYSHNGKNHFVSSWIRHMDGKYGALLLPCCNPGAHKVSSKKSAIVAPNDEYSPIGAEAGEVQLELYIPGIGYIDSYRENYLLNLIKNRPTTLPV